MKNGLPLILYIGVVGSAIVFLALRRESSRMIGINSSKQLLGEYYLYSKEDKLVYIATQKNKETWGKEAVKPCVYEMAVYKNYILAKSHPITYNFPDSKVADGLSNELYKEIKVDTLRSIYSLLNTSDSTTHIFSEWALFEKQLIMDSIPVNLAFLPVKNK
jgi:hypothetical protein